MLKIVKDNVKSLRNKSIPVNMPLSDKDRKTLLEMIDYLEKSQDEEYCQKHGIILLEIPYTVEGRIDYDYIMNLYYAKGGY